MATFMEILRVCRLGVTNDLGPGHADFAGVLARGVARKEGRMELAAKEAVLALLAKATTTARGGVAEHDQLREQEPDRPIAPAARPACAPAGWPMSTRPP